MSDERSYGPRADGHSLNVYYVYRESNNSSKDGFVKVGMTTLKDEDLAHAVDENGETLKPSAADGSISSYSLNDLLGEPGRWTANSERFDPISAVPVVGPDVYVKTIRGVDGNDGSKRLVPAVYQAACRRIGEQVKTAGVAVKIIECGLAVTWTAGEDGSMLFESQWTDHDLHRILRGVDGISNMNPANRAHGESEWFCNETASGVNTDDSVVIEAVHKAIRAMRHGEADLVEIYSLREEQAAAADKIARWLSAGTLDARREFLLGAVMRFGKTITTFAAIDRLMALTGTSVDDMRMLVVTHRPNVFSEWRENAKHSELNAKWRRSHDGHDLLEADFTVDAYGVAANGVQLMSAQAIDGTYEDGEVRHTEAYDADWDLVVIDEGHEGTNTENFRGVLDRLKTKAVLWVSGTPYNLMDRFDERNSFRWTVADEKDAARRYEEEHGEDAVNPYAPPQLPDIEYYTFDGGSILRLDDEKGRGSDKGVVLSDDGELNFRELFALDTNDKKYHKEHGVWPFKNMDAVQDFVASLYGAGRRAQRAKAVLAKMPYAKDRDGHMIWGDDQMRNSLWFLPPQQDVVRSLAELLKNDDRFSQYEIIPLTGDENGSSISAQEKYVKKVIADNGVSNRARKAGVIILTIGKLTMGATIPELGSVLMLADTDSAMQYNQTTFRCKSAYRPGPTMGAWRKERGLVFDFKRDRAVINLDAGFMSMMHMLSKDERSKQRKRNAAAIPVITYDDANNKFTRMDEQQRLKIFNGDFSKLGDVFSKGRAIEIEDIESAISKNKSVFERAGKAGGLSAELSWRMKLTDFISGGSPSEAKDDAPDPTTTSAPDPTMVSPAQQNQNQSEAEAEESETEKDHDATSLVEAVQNILKTISERLPAMTLVTVARMPLASVDENDVPNLRKLWDIIPREVKTAFLGLQWTKPSNVQTTLLDVVGVTQERCRLDEAISDVLSHARSTTDSMFRSLWNEAVELVGRPSDQNSKPSEYIRNVSSFYSKNVKKFEKNEIITPWNVVDMHLATTIGGESWCDGGDVRTEAKHVDTSLTADVYGSKSADGNGDDHPKPMLDIGCKGGLHSLWLAQSEYSRLSRRSLNPFNRDPERQQWDKWDQAVSRVYTMAVNERGAMLAEALLNGPHRVGWRAMVTPIEVVSKKFDGLMKIRMPKAAERNELMGLEKNTRGKDSKRIWNERYSSTALKKALLSMFTNDSSVDEYNRIMRSVEQLMMDRRGEWENMTVRQQMDVYDHIRSAVDELKDGPSCLSDHRPFAVAVGNPPYQSDNNNNIYQYFVFTANDIADIVSMITKGDFYSTPNPKMSNDEKSGLMTIIKKHGLSFRMPDDPFNGLVGATGGIAMFSFDHSSNGMPDFVEAYNHSDNPLRSLENTSSLAVSTRNPYGLAVLTASELANTDPDNIPVYSKAGIGRKPLSAFDDDARKHLKQWTVAWGKANGASVNKRVFIGEPFLVRPGIALSETFLCYWLDSETDARHFQKYVKTRFFRSCIAAMNPGHNFSTTTYKYVPDFIKDVKDNIDWDQLLDDIDDQLCSYFNVNQSVLDAVVEFDTPMLTIEQYAF